MKAEYFNRVVFPEATRRHGALPLVPLAQPLFSQSRRCRRRSLTLCRAWPCSGSTIDKEVALIDMEGMGMAFFRVVPAFKALNKVGAHFFPVR